MSQGLILFDKDRRVVMCNRRYMEIYGLTSEQVQPGTPISHLIQHRLALGLKVHSEHGDYVRTRIEGPVAPANAFHEFADGLRHSPAARRRRRGDARGRHRATAHRGAHQAHSAP
jgi:PAS domain-containing protein